MLEDEKYGFEEVDKITLNNLGAFSIIIGMVRFVVSYLLIYILIFVLYLIYMYVFEPFRSIEYSHDETTLLYISGILATLIYVYDLRNSVLKEKQKRYSILLSEKNNLEQRFKNILDVNPTTLKEYVVIFLVNYKSNYPDNLIDFKRLLYLCKKTTSKEIDDEIESYLKLLLLSKPSFKSIYGYEPIYDFKLIHEFSKTYGNSYKEEDLENLNRLLITKGIKIHDIKILNELVSEASFEYLYGLFTECMKTETSLDETGYVKATIELFGNNIDYHLPFLHRFLMERNLTSLEYNNFEEHIKTKIFELNLASGKKQLSVHDVDAMGGYDFEAFVGQLYEKMGYSVEQTPLSNDQGADLIISKYGERTAVQVKNYTSNVPNSAVQQAVAAKNYYGCSSCSVVTNSYFTKSAIELADVNGVKLVDRDELNYLINQYN